MYTKEASEWLLMAYLERTQTDFDAPAMNEQKARSSLGIALGSVQEATRNPVLLLSAQPLP